MNYENVYKRLMYSRISLSRKKGIEYEEHHIIPRSLGGSNDKSNLVLLTYREHFIAHRLLCKFTFGKDRTKMAYALFMMCRCNSSQNRIVNSRYYELSKNNIRKYCSGENNPNYGKNVFSPEQIEEIRLRQTGENNSMFGKVPWNKGVRGFKHTSETKEKMSKSAKGKQKSSQHKNNLSASLKGKNKSDEHKKKLSEAAKGRVKSKEELEKLSKAHTGKKQPILKCPHCGVSGGYTMKRWHFENCKDIK